MSDFPCTSKPRVLCAMSGGVDSSVAAKLLVEQGYDVIGVTMRLFDAGRVGHGDGHKADAASHDIADAKAVARKLGIPHHVYDCTTAFDEAVVSPFCQAYLKGLTPNPCVECNRHLKFGVLQDCRVKLGCDFVATGHYVRKAYDPDTRRHVIYRGADERKDQSYVLYHLTQEQLAHTLFPLGEQSKGTTRNVAAEAGLGVAEKSESQDICFIPDGDYAEFIQRRLRIDFEPGPIVDEDGTVLGQHRGLARYTLGQRKGLGVSAGRPLFVLSKDIASNTLVVGPKESLGIGAVTANEVNLVPFEDMPSPLRVQAKTNYKGALHDATAQVSQGRLIVTFDTPIRSAAPGQAVVLYQKDMLVGGGTITGFTRKKAPAAN